MDENKVAVLFALKNSIYKTIPGCDVYDIKRNALTFPGRLPIVAHPPCRAWGRLRGLANIVEEEKDLARWALSQVRQWGGYSNTLNVRPYGLSNHYHLGRREMNLGVLRYQLTSTGLVTGREKGLGFMCAVASLKKSRLTR